MQFFSLFLLQLPFNSDGNAGQEVKGHQVTEERGPSASIALWVFVPLKKQARFLVTCYPYCLM